jgi:hypothetical protein
VLEEGGDGVLEGGELLCRELLVVLQVKGEVGGDLGD